MNQSELIGTGLLGGTLKMSDPYPKTVNDMG